ncbi:MAG: restriction endonuclease subunit S [Sphaerospermopsis kisseleviana]
MSIPDGFKVSEVGVIPVDWDVKRLGDVADVIMGQSPLGSSYNQKGEGIPLINGPTEFTNRYPIKIQWTNSPTKICQLGDILLCIRGSSTGRMNISNDEYCIGRGVAAIIAKSNCTNSFLEFQVYNAVKLILKLSVGSTFPNIDSKSLKNLQIPLPPLAEQKAIAQSLSDVDNLITAIEKLITKKRNIKQGTMQELLTGKKRLPGFTGEWEVKKLGDVADIDSDNLRSDTNPNYCFKYISLENVEMGKLSDVSYCVFSSAPSRARRKVQKNDILVATVRPNLKSHLFVKFEVNDLICSTGFSVIRCNLDNFQPEFIYYHFFASIIDQQINTLLIGSNYPAINSSDIKSLKIPIPPLAEQKAIAKILTEMDEEIEALEKKREKYKNIKQGMMQELLTGKTRLKINLEDR